MSGSEPKRERIHAATCAVPDAYFADDHRCTCGLRDQIDTLFEFHSSADVEVSPAAVPAGPPMKKVHKVGHIFTDAGLAHAEGLRMIIAISHPDPGPPVALEMSERAWAALVPAVVEVGETEA